MGTVLDLQCMPRGSRSRTRRVSDAFFDAYMARLPNTRRIQRDLVGNVDELPAIDAWDVEAKIEITWGDGNLDEAQAERWNRIIRLTDELHAADLVVISAPMWNFQIPWYLKRWIDCVVQARLTFQMTDKGVDGLLGGRPCVVLTTRDGEYGPGTPMEAADFQLPYLKFILGFMGLGPVHIVSADGMAHPMREASLESAVNAAKALANTIGG